jgi:hypothetical protein
MAPGHRRESIRDLWEVCNGLSRAEGWFRNSRRFFSHFPSVQDEAHLARTLGLYLFGARPNRARREAFEHACPAAQGCLC